MNRLKKERIRLHNAARANKFAEQIADINSQDKLNEEIEKFSRKLHLEKFPEEYDFQFDNFSEYIDRIYKNINPMGQDYIDKINKIRVSKGFLPLAQNCMSQNQETMKFCIESAKKLYLIIN